MVRKAIVIAIYDNSTIELLSGVKMGHEKIKVSMDCEFNKMFEAKGYRYFKVKDMLKFVTSYIDGTFGDDIWSSWLFKTYRDLYEDLEGGEE